MYTTGKLYRTREPQLGKIGDKVGIRLIGDTVSITIYGSESKPDELADMADIAPDSSPFTSEGFLNFDLLPKYIAFDGTVTGIEVSNVALTLIDDIE